jgi:hypothetical protein
MEGLDPAEIHRNPLALRGLRLKIEATPPWISRRKVKNLAREDGYPVTMLLLDRQIAPDQPSRYTRYVRRLETPQAVQEAGRIEFDFDPATQILLIHAISIFRDGELTNHAKLDEIDVIQRERDLDQGIYSGSITALILLKDLRTGDIVDVESSIVSDDDIFPDHYWFTENLEHPLPVGRQYFSWLSKNHDLYKITPPEDTSQIEYTEEDTKWGLQKNWMKESTTALDIPPLLHLGFNPFKNISITSFKSWGQVAKEINRLWARTETPGKELPKELKKLQSSHPEGSIELIESLCAFVRDSVRYQGVEVGRLGLVPEELNTIWSRRFGDCKEKTSLLCWLLKESGFDAHPALVSVALRGKIFERPPAPIFDHVVVYLKHEDRDYWIDPTVISQRGPLSTWNSLPFEKALLISEETEEFIEIKEAPPEQDFIRVVESYRFNGNDATISVRQEFHGAEADGIRGILDSNGRSTMQKVFCETVKSTRAEAELTTDLEVSDDPENNLIILSGEFSATNALRRNPQTGRMICEFIPYSVIDKIHGIDNSNRSFPLGLYHPAEVFHAIELDHPDAKGAVVPKTIINNEFLEFEAGTKNENTHPTLFYHYRSKAPEVPVKDLHRYRLNLDQMSSVISLVFETNPGRDSTSKPMRQRRNWDEDEIEDNSSSTHAQPVRPSSDGSSPPVWLFIVGGIVIIKVIILILQQAAKI